MAAPRRAGNTGTVSTSPAPQLPAHVVGTAFVHQYYAILRRTPEEVHRFYHDNSRLTRPSAGGGTDTVTTLKGINTKIMAMDAALRMAEVETVVSHESHAGGVIVLVTGSHDGHRRRRRFSQCFFLAPQESGYFVLDDMFNYIGEDGGPARSAATQASGTAPALDGIGNLPVSDGEMFWSI